MANAKIDPPKLEKLLMEEIRRHRECDHVAGVAFLRPVRESPDHPNWVPSFVCDRPQSTPSLAFEIARRFQDEYELIWT
jgi:hypothetical protein